MRFIGLTQAQVEAVLVRFNRRHRTSIELRDVQTGGVRRPWVQGVLRLRVTAHPYHRRKLPRRDVRSGELEAVGGRMPCVCWHGHREVYRAVFKRHPEVTIRTGKATYKGPDHFEQTFEQTDVNIGSLISPLYFSQACDCRENGEDWEGQKAAIQHNLKVRRLQACAGAA